MSKAQKNDNKIGLSIQNFEIKVIKNLFSRPKSTLSITNQGLVFFDGARKDTYKYDVIKFCELKVPESLLYPEKYINIVFINDSEPDIRFYPTDTNSTDYDPIEECLMLINTFLG